jgi:PEP-CTERM motif
MKRVFHFPIVPVVGVTLLLLNTGIRASHAAGVLDQQLNPASYPPDDLVSAGFGGTQNLAQTFTVGITGTLSEVDVSVERFAFNPPTGTLYLQIRTTTGGVPAADPSFVLQASVPESALPIAGNYGFVPFDVSSAGLQVTPGEQLAIVLLAPNFANPVSWIGVQGDFYPAGGAFVEQEPDFGWISSGSGIDYGFQTFVATVPEPSTLSMAGLACLAGLACAMRKQMAHAR